MKWWQFALVGLVAALLMGAAIAVVLTVFPEPQQRDRNDPAYMR